MGSQTLALLLTFAVATPNPLLERAKKQYEDLYYDEVVNILDILLKNTDLNAADRQEALVLRANALAGWKNCDSTAIRAYLEVLALYPDFTQPGQESPKIRQCFELARGGQPLLSPDASTKPVPPFRTGPVVPPPAPLLEVAPAAPMDWLRPVGFVVGLGSLGFAVGAYLFELKQSRQLKIDVHAYNAKAEVYPDEYQTLTTRAQRLAAIETWMFSATALGLVATGYSVISVWLEPNTAQVRIKF